jgi:hypothetical protein
MCTSSFRVCSIVPVFACGFSGSHAGAQSVVPFTSEHSARGVIYNMSFAPPIAAPQDGYEMALADLATMLSAWGAQDSPADLDLDGAVGASDLATLLSAWGG